jgi:hypothetical protein
MKEHLSRTHWNFKRNSQLTSAAATIRALREIENGRSTAVKNTAEGWVYIWTEGQGAYKNSVRK